MSHWPWEAGLIGRLGEQAGPAASLATAAAAAWPWAETPST